MDLSEQQDWLMEVCSTEMHKKQEFTTVKTKKALKLKKCQGILKPKPFQILQIYKNKNKYLH